MEIDIKTVVSVNVRSGPSVAYQVVDTVKADQMFTAKDFKKDGGGVGWYKLGDDQWVCASFVTTKFNKAKILDGIAERNRKQRENRARVLGISNRAAKAVSTMSNDTSRQSRSNDFIVSGTGIVDSQSPVTDSILDGVMNSVSTGTAIDINAGIFDGLSAILGGDSTSGDIILNQRLFGAPFQFLPTTDIRPTDGADKELGIFFQSSVMAEAPVLSLLPGRPDYLANLSDEDKQALVENIFSMVDGVSSSISEAANEQLNAAQIDTKYFEFLPQHDEYMQYVNILCRLGAIYLGLDTGSNASDPSQGDNSMYRGYVPGTTQYYKNYDWRYYTMANTYGGKATTADIYESVAQFQDGLANLYGTLYGDNNRSDDSIANVIGKGTAQFSEIFDTSAYYIDFYISPSMNYSENFTNTTSESVLSSALGKASGMQKEFSFLMAAAGVNTADLNKDIDQAMKDLQTDAKTMLGEGGGAKVIGRLLNGARSVITGSNIVFPEVWQDSKFDRSYSFEIKLSTPYGDKESIYLEILVPLFHLLAFVLPCQTSVNTYANPFIVRSVLPGFFASEMGIVSDMTVNKGGSGDSWTADGFPTEVTVNMTIHDLYSSLSMSKIGSKEDIYNFVWNSGLLDYIGVQCGINMKKTEYAKKLEILWTIGQNIIPDLATHWIEGVKESVARSTIAILGGRR